MIGGADPSGAPLRWTPLGTGTAGAQALPIASSPRIRDFANYYASIRGERTMVARREIDPTAIPHLLAHVWLWRYEDGTFTLRLAGEVVARRFPTAKRGTTLEAFIPPMAIEMIRERYTRVVRTPAGVHVIGASIVEGGHSVFSERLILPLSDDGTTGDGLVGITVYGDTVFDNLSFVQESGSVETWIDLSRPDGRHAGG